MNFLVFFFKLTLIFLETNHTHTYTVNHRVSHLHNLPGPLRCSPVPYPPDSPAASLLASLLHNLVDSLARNQAFNQLVSQVQDRANNPRNNLPGTTPFPPLKRSCSSFLSRPSPLVSYLNDLFMMAFATFPHSLESQLLRWAIPPPNLLNPFDSL